MDSIANYICSNKRDPDMATRRQRGQVEMAFRRHGGKRRGAGRKPTTVRGGMVRAGVPHRRRRQHRAALPLHITLRLGDDVVASLRTLRRRDCYRVLRAAFVHGCCRDQGRFRICQYSVQRTHIHMIVEASDRQAISRGVQGFCIRVAKGLNRLLARKGRVFGDRYHEQALASPRQVRNTLAYVLNNARRHGEHRCMPAGMQRQWSDIYSSAVYFDGWRNPRALGRPPPDEPAPVAPAGTWLLGHGWRRHGPIAFDEMPAAGRRPVRA
jgi:REP element-mobilizing transposase RayT